MAKKLTKDEKIEILTIALQGMLDAFANNAQYGDDNEIKAVEDAQLAIASITHEGV